MQIRHARQLQAILFSFVFALHLCIDHLLRDSLLAKLYLFNPLNFFQLCLKDCLFHFHLLLLELKQFLRTSVVEWAFVT